MSNAALRPLSEATVLSPRQAAAELGSLGVNAGVFWLRQRGLVTTIPAEEFGRYRKRDPLELVRWGDVLDELASRRKPPEARRKRPRGFQSGGLR